MPPSPRVGVRITHPHPSARNADTCGYADSDRGGADRTGHVAARRLQVTGAPTAVPTELAAGKKGKKKSGKNGKKNGKKGKKGRLVAEPSLFGVGAGHLAGAQFYAAVAVAAVITATVAAALRRRSPAPLVAEQARLNLPGSVLA